MQVNTEGKLILIKLTQAEMYDLGNIDDIEHHILYDSGQEIAVDITAEVTQAPLLSRVRPYSVVSDTSVLEAFLSGEEKPVRNWRNAGSVPCITGFEAQELTGDEYLPVRESIIELRDAQRALDERVDEMRKHCLSANLVKYQEKVRR